eukprot:scaffold4954_cov93-Skeletonema_dohrnii-CCMP3373.AAC.2
MIGHDLSHPESCVPKRINADAALISIAAEQAADSKEVRTTNQRRRSMPTYLITGASSGIGLELVKQLVSSTGNEVFATVRSRGSSSTGVDGISAVVPVEGSSIIILEGIDVSKDDVDDALISQLDNSVIDVVVHNAGSLNGTRESTGQEMMTEQKLENISMDRMRAAFEVNTLGPLRVQKALLGANLMKCGMGKVAFISTELGSIDDNKSGGQYAYRVSKAGVNMAARSMSCDLKSKEISVRIIAPGFVATEFGPGKEKMKGWGAMSVEIAAKGIISLIESMTMENTGEFYCVQRDSSAKAFPW